MVVGRARWAKLRPYDVPTLSLRVSGSCSRVVLGGGGWSRLSVEGLALPGSFRVAYSSRSSQFYFKIIRVSRQNRKRWQTKRQGDLKVHRLHPARMAGQADLRRSHRRKNTPAPPALASGQGCTERSAAQVPGPWSHSATLRGQCERMGKPNSLRETWGGWITKWAVFAREL